MDPHPVSGLIILMVCCTSTSHHVSSLPQNNILIAEEGGQAHKHAAYFFKNISCEPIGYNTTISANGVEWG